MKSSDEIFQATFRDFQIDESLTIAFCDALYFPPRRRIDIRIQHIHIQRQFPVIIKKRAKCDCKVRDVALVR